MLIVGYWTGIRSERRLCERFTQSGLSLVLPGLDWMAASPITSTFPKNRHGRLRESDALPRMPKTVSNMARKIVVFSIS